MIERPRPLGRTRARVSLPLLFAVAGLLAGRSAGAADPADVVYENGRIYTVVERQPWAEAVAVRGGRIVKVGATAEMKPLVGAQTRVVDLGGKLVLPGLIDSHTHPSLEAEQPWHYETGFPWTFVMRHQRLQAWVPSSLGQRVRALAVSMQLMSSLGITAFGEGKTEEAVLPAWETFIRERGLNQHVVLFMPALDARGPAAMHGARQLQEAFRRHRLPGVRLGAKLFIDGYLEHRTAYLVEPYEGSRAKGTLNAPPAVIRALVDELDAAGLMIQAHAIGDGAVRVALDAFEPVMRRRAAGAGPPHTIVHLKLVHPDDLPRFARLHVGATLYPFVAQPGPASDFLLGALGPGRVEEQYLPIRKLWDAGAVVGSNSDWASVTMDPFHGMYVGVTRASPHHPERGTLGAGNAVTLERMIRSYTIDNAALLDMAHETGSIEPGKWADLVVLDRNILERPIEELLETHVEATVFQGKVVYDGSSRLPAAVKSKERELLELGHDH